MPSIKLKPGQRVLIAQPQGIGDVVACLPLAGAIKRHWPDSRIYFATNPYARAVVERCSHVDHCLSVPDLVEDARILRALQIDIFLNPSRHPALAEQAQSVRVPVRVGNLRRLRSIQNCNQFVYYGRNRSGLHEAQLNLKELGALGLPARYNEMEISQLYGLDRIEPLPASLETLLSKQRFNLLLHVKSNGNSREWPIAYFHELAQRLPSDRFKLFVTGSVLEGDWVREKMPGLLDHPNVTDLTGRLDLAQLISFIAHADGLLAASTGPLHLAAALGKHALGVYPPLQGRDVTRWGPLGARADALSLDKVCRSYPHSCGRRETDGGSCACMHQLTPATVENRILKWVA